MYGIERRPVSDDSSTTQIKTPELEYKINKLDSLVESQNFRINDMMVILSKLTHITPYTEKVNEPTEVNTNRTYLDDLDIITGMVIKNNNLLENIIKDMSRVL